MLDGIGGGVFKGGLVMSGKGNIPRGGGGGKDEVERVPILKCLGGTEKGPVNTGNEGRVYWGCEGKGGTCLCSIVHGGGDGGGMTSVLC